jgi:hypothetical protein
MLSANVNQDAQALASTFLGSGPHTLWIKMLKNETLKQSLSCPSVCLSFIDFYLSRLKSSFGKLLQKDLHSILPSLSVVNICTVPLMLYVDNKLNFLLDFTTKG